MNKKGLFGMAILFLSILLMGCNANHNDIQEGPEESILEMQNNLSNLETKKVIITYKDKEAILENEEAEEFVDVLDVSKWKFKNDNNTSKEEVMNCELYESINTAKERRVATITFYDDNTIKFKSQIIKLSFTIQEDIFDKVKQYVE